MNLNIDILSMEDIGWDRGEIDETGSTIEENSLIKAQAILSFCQIHNISYPIMTDDSGLFVEALNGEPGIYTAKYRCCVTTMMPDGKYYQEFGESCGTITEKLIGELKKTYFYAIFILNGSNVAFNELKGENLNNTYRYKAIRKSLKKVLMK